MIYPSFEEEKLLWKAGYKRVAGLDEAGRGPLAGPVVAAAVILNTKIFKNIKDSKKLSETKREEIFEKLTNCKEVKWGIGAVSEKVIDKINILQATKLAMRKAVSKLNADFLLIDGNFGLKNIKIPQKSIVKGDQKVFSIAAASIIAKVWRDRLMKKYHKKYPQYGFDKHKGYGTRAHIEKISEHGLCPIHRVTFRPCSALSSDRAPCLGQGDLSTVDLPKI